MKTQNSVVFVTGANRGFGLAVAGKNETFGDEVTRSVKSGLSAEKASYFDGSGL